MTHFRLFPARPLGAWLGLLAVVLSAAGLSGCASGGPAAAPVAEAYTESDVPENRKRASTRLNLAVLYFQDAKYNIALDEVKQAIQIDPNWYQPYWMRGLIQMQANDLAGAESSFQRALSLNAASSDVRHNYGVLLCKMKRPSEAVKMFGAALADPAYGQRAKTWQEQGICQLASGQRAEAETSFLRSYELDPGNPVTGYNLAQLLFERGDAVRAQFYARRINNSERASAGSLWLGIKIERQLGLREAQSELEAQLVRRFANSREALALERGAFNE